ncbi:MAG: phosphotransferase [Eubacterium sp.]|nr:phosphotransferase [Eubacterium sp.]
MKKTIKLCGRIDSNNAAQKESEILEEIEAGYDSPDDTDDTSQKEIVLDAEKLEYISSAGLRILMKLRKTYGDSFSIINTSPEVYEIFETTGFTQLFDVKKRLRSIDIDGCEVIGRGFYGTVYRIDIDTIVKVYNTPDAVSMIENEQKMAKLAFLNGIPTAISYDTVKVGDSYGSVFELLRSETFNDLIKKDDCDLEKVTTEYVEFLKQVHSIDLGDVDLPRAKDIYLNYVEFDRPYLTGEQYDRLRELLTALPDENHLVHGDFQMKNVMLSDGEPMLIDMDTLSAGAPVFDLGPLYATYRLFGEDEPENSMNFLGISEETTAFIWDKIMDVYFGADHPALEEITDKIKLVANLRFLYVVTATELKDSELGQTRIRHALEHIDELLSKVSTLEF